MVLVPDRLATDEENAVSDDARSEFIKMYDDWIAKNAKWEAAVPTQPTKQDVDRYMALLELEMRNRQ